MSVEIRGEVDAGLEAIASALGAYEKDHQAAKITLYRNSRFSVRIRIIDPDFTGMRRVDRSDRVWDYLARLSEDDQADIHQFVVIAPREVEKSLGNFVFENPVEADWAEN